MYLGLDIGTKRTGVAISAGELAREYATLPTNEQLAQQLKEICELESVTTIIAGLPFNEDGTRSAQTDWAEAQLNMLKTALGIPFIEVNEYLTTHEARRILTQAGASPQVIDERIDQVAAQLILQQYIDSHRD